MKPVNCVIVDDQEIDRLVIEDHLQNYSWLKLAGSFSNPLECISLLQRNDIDLVFMDIHMPLVNGIDFFKTIANPPLCIFITDHPAHAPEAFDVNAIDYLLKPVSKERFDKAVNRVYAFLQIKTKALNYDMQIEKDTITIKEGSSINKLYIHDIIYLEAISNYTRIVTAFKKYITLSNLKQLMDQLPENKFVRIHRSYAVAIDKIQRIENREVYAEDAVLPVGKTYRHEVNTLMFKKPASLN